MIMKTISIFSKAIVIAGLVCLTSCSSSDSNDTTPTNPTKTTFKLDGVLITADETTATLYNNEVAGGQYLDVYAIKDGVQILEMHMPAAAASYPVQHVALTMTDSWLTYQANAGATFPTDYFDSTTGNMNLTTYDLANHKLVGTFNFIGNNSTSNKTITEGHLIANTITNNL